MMGTLVIGIDPGKGGGMVLTEPGKVLLKAPTPVTVGKGRQMYSFPGINEWLKGARIFANERNGAHLVAGLEKSWPIPAKDVLPEVEYKKFAEDIQKTFSRSKDFAPEARDEWEKYAVIERLKVMLQKFWGGRESNWTSFQQGEGVMLWRVFLWFNDIRWEEFTSNEWHAEICKNATGVNAKARSLWAAQRLYPQENFFKSERGRTPYSGIYDAANVAEAARRRFAVSAEVF